MRIKNMRQGHICKNGGFFIVRHGSVLSLSSEVRDHILPRRHFFLDISDGIIRFTPTDSEEGSYKVSLTKANQAKACWDRANDYCFIPIKQRIYGEAVGNEILFRLGMEAK